MYKHLSFIFAISFLNACYSELPDEPICFFDDKVFLKNPNLRIETQRCCTERIECRQSFHDAIDQKVLKVSKLIVDNFVACELIEDEDQYGVCALKTSEENSECRDDLDCKTSATSTLKCQVVDDERCVERFGEAFQMSTNGESTQKRCALCL
jgi:hypothetical protein